MILVDTPVWIDHFRTGDAGLARLLQSQQVFAHPFVVGEIALGRLKNRGLILESLDNLPAAPVVRHAEIRAFIEAHDLAGTGIGYIDAHLLAAAQLVPGTRLWTRDKKLHAAAAALDLAMEETSQS